MALVSVPQTRSVQTSESVRGLTVPTTTIPEFLTVQEAGRMLRLSTHRVLKLIHEKRLDAADVGTGERPRWRITVASIRRFTGIKD